MCLRRLRCNLQLTRTPELAQELKACPYALEAEQLLEKDKVEAALKSCEKGLAFVGALKTRFALLQTLQLSTEVLLFRKVSRMAFALKSKVKKTDFKNVCPVKTFEKKTDSEKKNYARLSKKSFLDENYLMSVFQFSN